MTISDGALLSGIPSPIIDAALQVLADGKPRTADEILAEGLRLGLFDASTTRKHVYTSLMQYVERAVGAARRPEIVEDADHRFRLNRPPDPWPDLDTTGLPPLGAAAATPAAQAAIAHLNAAATGSDPTAFEVAVCGAFAALGFAAKHVGGENAPDGYADAPLGTLGYRVMLECKLLQAVSISHSSAAAEAAKFKTGFRGDYCALIAPAFDGEVTFLNELQTHGVSAWSVDDLTQALRGAVIPAEMRELLVPGLASDALGALFWERRHGAAKRLRAIASLVLSEACAQQRVALTTGVPADAPSFTVDVAMALVDARLASSGANVGCARADVRSAFDWLTNPLVGRALWSDAQHTAIVVTRG